MKKWLLASVTLGLLGVGVAIFLLWPHTLPKVTATAPTGGSTLAVGTYKAPESITAEAILQDVNTYRVAHNLPALVEDPLLMKSAEHKCQDMIANNYYAHQNPVTGEYGDTYARQIDPNLAGYAENLAGGNVSSQDIVDKWIASPGHLANIVNTHVTNTGVAICIIPAFPGDTTAVQQFGSLK